MNKYGPFVALCLTTVTTTTLAMDIPLAGIKQLHAVQWITPRTLLLASSSGLHSLSDFQTATPIITMIHDVPTNNILCNSSKTIVGCMRKEHFITCDTQKFKEIWSQSFYTHKYSAAFGLDDTIFVYAKDELYSSTTKYPTILPSLIPDDNPGISCNPTKKEIAYPSFDKTLSIKSLDCKSLTDHSLNILRNHAIQRTMYSPTGTHIALLTHAHNVFIFNTTTQQAHFIGRYHNVIFFNHYIIVLMTDHGAIDFCNYQTNQLLIQFGPTSPKRLSVDLRTNMLDISPTQMYFAAILGNECVITPIPFTFIKNKFVLIYWLIKQRFYNPAEPIFPLETIHLIMSHMIKPHLS